MVGFKIENNHTCRVCLKSKNNEIFSIYDKISQEYNEPIFSMIIYCASINISKDDGLPEVVCDSCKIRLETAYLFKRDCEESDAKLRMKIEYSCSDTDNIECAETLDSENVKLERDKTDAFQYESIDNETTVDPLYPNMYVTAEIQDSKFSYVNSKESISIKTEIISDRNSNSSVSDEEIENDEDYIPKKTNRKRKKKSLDESKSRKIICYVCIKIFYTQTDYDNHTIEHPNEKYVCEDQNNCNMQFTNYLKYALHRKNDHLIEDYLTCKECQRNFSNKRSFDRHLFNQHGDRPYGCVKCSKMFREESALQNHMKVHSKEYKCEFCEKIFSTSFRLSTHRRLHTLEKPYDCSECGKKWIDKSTLNKHIESHHKGKQPRRKEKNHLCSFCGQTFNRPDLLTKHIRTHTGVKPFSCDHCEYRCRDKQLLRSHIRTHTGDRPYKCSYCEKAFGSRGYLTIHERFHSGHRPYICSTCNKGFTNSKDLKVHERTHTGIKLFSCNICSNSFTTLHYLRVHTKKHDA